MQVKLAIAVLALASTAAAAPCRKPRTTVWRAVLDGNAVIECFSTVDRRCWRLDLATTRWTLVAVPPDRPRPALPTAPSQTVITACAPDGRACHTVTTPVSDHLPVVSRGELSAVVQDRAITVVDGDTDTALMTITPWPHPDNHIVWSFRGDVRWLNDDRLFVELGDGFTTLAHVIDVRTGVTNMVLPGELDAAPAVARGDDLAVASIAGTVLHVIDHDSFELRSLLLFPTPHALALLAETPAHATVAVQRGGDGEVAIVDAGRDHTRQPARHMPGPPVCP